MSNGPRDFPPPSDDPHRMEQPPETIDGLRLFERPQDGEFGRIVYQGKERPTFAPPRSAAHEYWFIKEGDRGDWRLTHAIATFDREDGYQTHVEELVDTHSNNQAPVDDLERHVGRPVGGTVVKHFRDGTIRFAPEFSKEEAGYVDPADSAFDRDHDPCATCVHYIPGHGCHFVQGEILPNAYCERFYANYGVFANDHGGETTVNAELMGAGFDWDESNLQDFRDEVEESIRQAIQGRDTGRNRRD